MGSVAQGFLHGGSSNAAQCSKCPALSPALNEQWCTDSPMWQHGDWVSLALGLGCPQYLALHCQPPWEGPSGADLALWLANRRH